MGHLEDAAVVSDGVALLPPAERRLGVRSVSGDVIYVPGREGPVVGAAALCGEGRRKAPHSIENRVENQGEMHPHKFQGHSLDRASRTYPIEDDSVPISWRAASPNLCLQPRHYSRQESETQQKLRRAHDPPLPSRPCTEVRTE